jgi:hypothetical protein
MSLCPQLAKAHRSACSSPRAVVAAILFVVQDLVVASFAAAEASGLIPQLLASAAAKSILAVPRYQLASRTLTVVVPGCGLGR